MTARDFCFWLQGFFEIHGAHAPDDKAGSLTVQQAEMIRWHLSLVFKHEIDPSMGPPEKQAELNAIHAGAETIEALKKRIEELESRPPQKLVASSNLFPGPVMRC